MTNTSSLPTTQKLPRKLLLSGIAVAIVAVCGWFFGFYLPNSNTLELSGLVQAKEIKNASRFGGRVVKILANEGDWVKEGQDLILFDDVELKSKIVDAKAALTEAKARQRMLLRGADPGEMKQAQAKIAQASENVRLLVRGAQPDQLAQLEATSVAAKGKLDSAQSAYVNADRMLQEGIISQQKYDEIRAGYDTAKSFYDSASTALKTARRGTGTDELHVAKTQLAASRASYQQMARGAKPEEIAIAAAAVDQAQSAVDALNAQLSEITLKAPISGLVSVISVAQGELVQPGRPVVTIIDPAHLWTDVYIPESRLGMVKVGQTVRVKPIVVKNDLYEGRVSAISPKSEFVPGSDGASTDEEASFKVKIDINSPKQDQRLRSGMNVHVVFNK